jgi:N-succinyldiaminopimelate aminotransferase
MPRTPALARRVEAILGGDFGRAPTQTAKPPIRLHIGDSDTPPGPEMPLAAELGDLSPWWFRYPATNGTGRLRDALADYYRSMHELVTQSEQILVTPGATAGLNTLVHLLCEEGDEVIVPTPAWPLFRGMVQLAGAVPVEVPLHDEADALDAAGVAARVEDAITERTVMLYINTPNNPSGTLLEPAHCEALLEVARRHSLWVVSDEAYDGMAFDGRATPTLARLDASTIVVSTFSKMHRAAGLRLGWIRGTTELVAAATRVATFQNYSASAAAQVLAEPTVRSRADWQPNVLSALQERRDQFMDALGLEVARPAGTYFAFLDLGRWIEGADGREAAIALHERGVLATPGVEFGRDYDRWIRLCFAS